MPQSAPTPIPSSAAEAAPAGDLAEPHRDEMEALRGEIAEVQDVTVTVGRLALQTRGVAQSLTMDLHTDAGLERSLARAAERARQAMDDAAMQDLDSEVDRAIAALAKTREAAEQLDETVSTLRTMFEMLLPNMPPEEAVKAWRLVMRGDRAFGMTCLQHLPRAARGCMTAADVTLVLAKDLSASDVRELGWFLRAGGARRADIDRPFFRAILAADLPEALALLEHPGSGVAALAAEDMSPLFEHAEQDIRLRAMACMDRVKPTEPEPATPSTSAVRPLVCRTSRT